MANEERYAKKTNVDLREEIIPGDEPVKTEEYWRKKGTEDEPILAEMRERMRAGWHYWSNTFDNAREDFDFAYKRQWTDADLSERSADRRPVLTMNILAQQINHIVGLARRSKMSIHVAAMGGINEKMPLMHSSSGNMMTYAEVMEGLIREVEARSNASKLYSRAMQHAVEGGFGWLQICTVQPDDAPGDMELKIHHIRDRWSVMFDPNAEEDLFQDARWCCITKRMPRDQFEMHWPDIPPHLGPWSQLPEYGGSFGEWWGGEHDVRVTDYYYRKPEDRTIVSLRHPSEGNVLWDFESNLEPFMDELQNMGYEILGKEKKTVNVVKFIRASGEYILEGPYDWPSCYLPIIPVLGRQVDGGDKTDYLSLTRFATDAQKMFNMWISAATERIQMSPKAQWMADVDAIEGFEEEWENQHRTATPLLRYKNPSLDKDMSPERIDPPPMPGAELALVELGKQMVMDVTGIHEAQRGLRSNETSGTAIARRREAGEIGSYEFIDNLASSIRHLGIVMCDMIARTYTDDRIRRVILPDDTQAEVRLYHTITDEQTGKQHQLGLLNMGRYMVTVEAGRESSTEREKFLEMMTEWGKNDPESMAMVRDKVMENMDVPGAYQLAKRFKMLIPRHLLSPEEQENMPPPAPPDPKTVADQMEAQADIETAKLEVQREELKLKQQEVELEIAIIKAQAEAQIAGKEIRAKDQEIEEKKLDRKEEKEKEKEQEVDKRVKEKMTPSKKPS